MKVLKTLKIVLALTVLVLASSCHPEQINPKNTAGDSKLEPVVIND